MTRSSVLLIDRGDLPSLAACATHAEPDQLVLWHPLETDAAASRRRAAVAAHARAWSIERVIVGGSVDLGVPGMAPPPELYAVSMLIQALAAARQLQCERVIWPVQVGPDAEAVSAAVERAELVGTLARDPASGGSIGVELPMVDFEDTHIVELAEDSGAPMRAFWPCLGAAATPCDACPECSRWHSAFGAIGLVWPWPGGSEPAAATAAVAGPA